MSGWRKMEVVVGVAWLLLLVFGATEVGPQLVVVGLVAVGVYLLARRLIPTIRRWSRSQRPPLPDLAVLPPGGLYGTRAPVPLQVLERALAEADLGAAERDGPRLTVRDRSGDWAMFTVEDPSRVALGGLRLEATSVEHAILCCDALAPSLGPLRFRGEGIELLVDGTKPRTELETEIRDLQMQRLRSLQRELDHLAQPSSNGSQRSYLN